LCSKYPNADRVTIIRDLISTTCDFINSSTTAVIGIGIAAACAHPLLGVAYAVACGLLWLLKGPPEPLECVLGTDSAMTPQG
jgi:hypothetical protein